jgi:hypothetical protein
MATPYRAGKVRAAARWTRLCAGVTGEPAAAGFLQSLSAFREANAAQAFHYRVLFQLQCLRAAVPRPEVTKMGDRVHLRSQLDPLGKRRPPPVEIAFQTQ